MKRYIICTWTVITCRCVPNFLYPFLKGKTFRSFPFLSLCKLCNYKYGWWLNLGYYCLDNIPWQLLQQYSMTNSNLGSWSLSLNEFRTWTQTVPEPGRADSEAMEDCCLLVCSQWFAQLAFLQKPGSPAQEWPHPQWPEPSPINHSLKMSQVLQMVLMEAFSQLNIPLFR